jgi:hypothetical protein
MTLTLPPLAVGALTLALASGGTVSLATGNDPAPTPPVVAPLAAHFRSDGLVTNPYFPLRPGTRFIYHGRKDGQPAVDIFDVTYQKKTIQGVVCRVVKDRLFLGGLLRERTSDWYAQATWGAVWYFGEQTAELDRHGHVVSREGSWMAGRHGARAGVYMTAHPRVGQTREQEHYRGHAEDHFMVLDLGATVSVPLLRSDHALLTKEWTPLEPGVVDHKYYVRDVGMVREASVKGPVEIGDLYSVQHRP